MRPIHFPRHQGWPDDRRNTEAVCLFLAWTAKEGEMLVRAAAHLDVHVPKFRRQHLNNSPSKCKSQQALNVSRIAISRRIPRFDITSRPPLGADTGCAVSFSSSIRKSIIRDEAVPRSGLTERSSVRPKTSGDPSQVRKVVISCDNHE